MPRGSSWSKMTPTERSDEMIRRRAVAQKNKAKRLREEPSTESPFPVTPTITMSRRTLRGLISDLETIASELKSMFGV